MKQKKRRHSGRRAPRSPELTEVQGIQLQQVLDVEIESLTGDGRALARIQTPQGQGLAVFVDHGLPGQLVRVQITGLQQKRVEARRLEILRKAQNERPAPCPHFVECGGCAWQDLSIEAQLQWKSRLAQEALRRLAGLRDLDLASCEASPLEFGFRNKIELAFAGRGSSLRLGMRRRRSNEVLETTDCLLMAEPAMRVREIAARFCRDNGAPAFAADSGEGLWRFLVVRRSHCDGRLSVECVTAMHEAAAQSAADLAEKLMAEEPALDVFIHGVRTAESQVAASESVLRIVGREGPSDGSLLEDVEGLRFSLSPGVFFQTNTSAAALLARRVAAMAGEGTGLALDVYGGQGFFGQRLATVFDEVVVLESAARAVEAGIRTASLNGVDRVRFANEPAGRGLGRLLEQGRHVDVAVVDPPRAGLEASVKRSLSRLRPDRLICVSCHPATLARDLKDLSSVFQVKEARAVDMFPHSPHVEMAVLCTPKD